MMAAVRVYIELNRSDGDGPFCLMTSFPRKVFTSDDYEKPLDQLGNINIISYFISPMLNFYNITIYKLNYFFNKIINKNVLILC